MHARNSALLGELKSNYVGKHIKNLNYVDAKTSLCAIQNFAKIIYTFYRSDNRPIYYLYL